MKKEKEKQLAQNENPKALIDASAILNKILCDTYDSVLTPQDYHQYKGSWRIMRTRPDKPANAKRTAASVWTSILNPISKEALIGVT